MKRKTNKIKSLLLTISSSTVINWIMLIIFVAGIICGFNQIFFKVMCFVFWIELMFMQCNTYYYIESEEEKDEQSNTNETAN